MVTTATTDSESSEMATQAAIHTEGLTKYYGRHLGIEDVNLDVL